MTSSELAASYNEWVEATTELRRFTEQYIVVQVGANKPIEEPKKAIDIEFRQEVKRLRKRVDEAWKSYREALFNDLILQRVEVE